MVQRRDFGVFILLNIITCGIYSLFFIYSATKDVNTMAGNDGKTMNPSIAVALTILTGTFYALWWIYRMGGRMYTLGNQNSISIEENGPAYLLWMIVGYLLCGTGTVVAAFLFIKNFNKLADGYNASMNTASAYTV